MAGSRVMGVLCVGLFTLSGCAGGNQVTLNPEATTRQEVPRSVEAGSQKFYPEYAQPPCNLSRDEQARVLSNVYRNEERLDRLILGAACAGRERRQALRLKFRHQYPTMNDEEIDVLVRDAARREPSPYADSPPAFAPPSPGQKSCISNRIGDTVYTDCY